MKTCKACGKSLPETTFDNMGYGKRRATCRRCRRIRKEGKEPNIPIVTQCPHGVDEGVACQQCALAGKPPAFQKLVELAAKRPVQFELLCNLLGLAPIAVRRLIDQARQAGYQLHVEHDYVGVRPTPPDPRPRETHIAPVVGERQFIGVISDTHLGSKYCMRDALRDFVNYAYKQGVREILHPGDVLDGDYQHAKFEMSHMGLDAQILDLFETLPQLAGLSYHIITGNHDQTFTDKSGVDVGKAIETYFKAHGRADLRAWGNRGATLRVRGAVIHLWHPLGSPSYATSYQLQKKVESYSPGEKPQILLTGHWHRYCHIYERGIHAFACPTFQAPGSAFSRALTYGAPALGGMIIGWDLTEHGTIRTLVHEKRTYYVEEKPQDIA